MELGGRNGTNSVTNWLLSGTKGQPEPTVGMGATILCWTDRHAGTIVKVWKDRKVYLIEVQEDKATRTDKNGMSECQEYSYEANPAGLTTTFMMTKTKGWIQAYVGETGRWRQIQGGNGLRIGERRKYNDFSF